MKIAVIIAAAALAAAFAPSVQTQERAEQEGAEQERAEQEGAGNVERLRLSVGGKSIDELIIDGRFVNPEDEVVFSQLFGFSAFRDEDRRQREALRRVLERLDQGDFVPPVPEQLGINETAVRSLSGLSGFSVAEFAKAVLNPGLEQERRTNGLIGDYLVVFDATGRKGRGHLSFDLETCLPETGTDECLETSPTILRHYEIEVLQAGFELHKRQGNKANLNPNPDPDLFPDPLIPFPVPFPGKPEADPFPNTVQLPEETIRDIWKPTRDLNRKLFAVGEKILITRLLIQTNGGAIMDIPDGDIRREQNDVSCIDLMAHIDPGDGFPTHRIDPVFEKQSTYCLGGCFNFINGNDKRDIINSM